MLIRRVTLENYGLFAGHHEFDLVPREKYGRIRPIVLFGGNNGAGKTTLLDAIRLALYGRTALGNRVRQVDYEKFLRARVHRHQGDQLPFKHALVAVDFDYVQLGELKSYRVERTWRLRRRRGVDETFSLLEEGEAIRDVDQDIAEAFVREIVPEGLSQLFFFDGEKIRELAEDETGDDVLAESIKALLGLDAVERLATDLSIYVSRKAGELADRDQAAELGALDEELAGFKRKNEELARRLVRLEQEIDGVEDDIRLAEQELRREGHVFARKRDQLRNTAEITSRFTRRQGWLGSSIWARSCQRLSSCSS